MNALNGLRGISCLIVFNYHLLFVFTHATDRSWGTVTDHGDNKGFMQLPFVRLLYAGHSMVIIFFVISGYVLSHKPMKLMRAGKYAELQQNLSSSVFRRGMRLFGPAITGTFITMILTHVGLFEAGKHVRTDPELFKGNNEEHPVLFASIYEQLGDWTHEMGRLVTDVWGWGLYYNNYDPHLWTIPLEFRSSMLLFLSLLGFSRLRPLPRLVAMLALCSLCFIYWARWEVFLFLAGMLFAELDLVSGIFTDTSPLDEKAKGGSRPYMRFTWALVLIFGLFLSSCPTLEANNAPGFAYLSSFMPASYDGQTARPLQALGGSLVVWSFMHLPRVQRLFNTSFAQYFGKISYAFYIVHGPILHCFGYNLVLFCWSWTGQETEAEYALGLGLATTVILPIAVWAADLFVRAVDLPCVELARSIESRLSTG